MLQLIWIRVLVASGVIGLRLRKIRRIDVMLWFGMWPMIMIAVVFVQHWMHEMIGTEIFADLIHEQLLNVKAIPMQQIVHNAPASDSIRLAVDVGRMLRFTT